jgi:hypothetical protein
MLREDWSRARVGVFVPFTSGYSCGATCTTMASARSRRLAASATAVRERH